MTGTVFGMAEVITTFLEAYIGFLFSSGFLTERRDLYRKFFVAAWIWTLAILCMNHYQLFSAWGSVIAISVWVVTTVFICKTDFLWTLLSYALYVILIHIIDFLSISIWGLVFGNSQFGILIISGYSVYRLIHIVFCKFLLIIIWIFFLRKMAGKIKLAVKRMMMAAIVGGVLIWYLGSLTFTTTEVSLTITWGILLCVLLTGICLMKEYSNWKDSKSQYDLATERNDWMARNYQHNQIFYHDLNNHYLVIKGLLEKKEYEQAKRYMEKLGEPLNLSRLSWTENEALDILLNHKLAIAHEKSIEMEIVPDKIILKLPDKDLTVLFGNAIDNAIEACEKVEKKERWIRLQMKQAGDMCFFKLSNPVSGEDNAWAEPDFTTKEDKSRHGLGIISMKIIAEKYGGIVETGIENGEFVLSISFFDNFDGNDIGFEGQT